MTEEPLSGGNVTTVVRLGDTVRRPAGPWTPAVHALLGYLHDVGFRGAPRPLGVDEQGREVLTYVPGEPAWPDRFDRLDPDDALAAVARLIREFHDAVGGFRPPADARWRALWPPHGDEIIAHHDLAPWNLVLGDRWAFIDWDGAGPGTRLWDLAYALHGFVPLSADPHRAGVRFGHRLRVFADAYGLGEGERRDLVELLDVPAGAMYDLLADGAATGTQPWARLWNEGHGAVWRADTDFIAARRADWLAALLD
ncbi:MAG TPA: aminoglycoside phosphotransferase family protein [Actinocatenispora sp.]